MAAEASPLNKGGAVSRHGVKAEQARITGYLRYVMRTIRI